MDAITLAEEFIASHPTSGDAELLSQLLRSLQRGCDFDVNALYTLNLDTFELAIEVLNEWRLQRYYRGSAVAAAATLQ
ncbi:MAG: hypothetical protein KGL68_18445 [Burkholderiales bacterium]|nr:hypothetical protein [Burkholderiales bacterium]